MSTSKVAMAEIVSLREPRPRGRDDAADRLFSEMTTSWQTEIVSAGVIPYLHAAVIP